MKRKRVGKNSKTKNKINFHIEKKQETKKSKFKVKRQYTKIRLKDSQSI